MDEGKPLYKKDVNLYLRCTELMVVRSERISQLEWLMMLGKMCLGDLESPG